MSAPTNTVYETIRSKLKNAGVIFDEYIHEAVTTSEQAAKIRNTNPHEGAKALVLDVDKTFVVLVLPGDCRADLDALQVFLHAKKVRMASRESVEAKTGVLIGGVPPFGSVIGMQTYLDPSLGDNEYISFNAGLRERSIRMKYSDYIAIEKPIVVLS